MHQNHWILHFFTQELMVFKQKGLSGEPSENANWNSGRFPETNSKNNLFLKIFRDETNENIFYFKVSMFKLQNSKKMYFPPFHRKISSPIDCFGFFLTKPNSIHFFRKLYRTLLVKTETEYKISDWKYPFEILNSVSALANWLNPHRMKQRSVSLGTKL